MAFTTPASLLSSSNLTGTWTNVRTRFRSFWAIRCPEGRVGMVVNVQTKGGKIAKHRLGMGVYPGVFEVGTLCLTAGEGFLEVDGKKTRATDDTRCFYAGNTSKGVFKVLFHPSNGRFWVSCTHNTMAHRENHYFDTFEEAATFVCENWLAF